MLSSARYIIRFMLVLSWFPLILPLRSCQEYYTPVIDATGNVLVVEGQITNRPGRDSIRLSLALPFNEQGRFPSVEGAAVSVSDDEGNSWMLEEFPGGVYYMPEGWRGNIGTSYVLHIETPDGQAYLSDTSTINPVPEIDSMYSTFKEKDILRKNSNGQYILIRDPGLDLAFNTQGVVNADICLKFEWIAQIQYMVLISFPTRSVDSHFINITGSMVSSTNPVVNVFDPPGVNELIPGNRLAFFGMSQMNPPAKPPPPGARNISSASMGVLVFTWLYSIDRPAHEYWEDVSEQLYAEGKLFDPVQTRIQGNIRCVSDSTKMAFGYFSASAVSDYVFYTYLRDDHSVYYREVDLDPENMYIKLDSIGPPQWIWPNH